MATLAKLSLHQGQVATTPSAPTVLASNNLCSAAQATVCESSGKCETKPPWTLNIPQFIEVDLAAKKLSTTEASGENRTTPIKNVERSGGQITLQGAEAGRAFSFAINEATGLASIPTADGQPYALASGWAWAIVTQDPERQGAALALIEFLMNPVNQGEYTLAASWLPSQRAALMVWGNADPYTEFGDFLLSQAQPLPDAALQAVVAEAIQDAFEDILLTDQITVFTVLCTDTGQHCQKSDAESQRRSRIMGKSLHCRNQKCDDNQRKPPAGFLLGKGDCGKQDQHQDSRISKYILNPVWDDVTQSHGIR